MWDKFDSKIPPRRDVVECVIIRFGGIRCASTYKIEFQFNLTGSA